MDGDAFLVDGYRWMMVAAFLGWMGNGRCPWSADAAECVVWLLVE